MHNKLFEAAHSGDADFIRRTSELQPKDLLERTVEGNSVLHIAAKLGHFHVTLVVTCLQPSLLMDRNHRGDTPLQCAAAAGHLKIVRLFLSQRDSIPHGEPHPRLHGMQLLRLKDRVGNTALHGATQNCHVAVVALLMETGHESAAMVNNAGVSALYMAAERGSVAIARILLEYPTTSHQGPHGQVALHAAVLRSYEITELILERGLDYLKHGDSSSSTPLHFAAANGDLRMVQMLLERDASIAYIQDKEGFSAIHTAASAGDVKIVKEILAQCRDAMEQKNEKGQNFLHTAIEKKNLEVVKYVLKSPLLMELINEQDDQGNTPLHLAVMTQEKKIIQALLSSGIIDAGVMNNSGYTPVDLASANVRTEIGLRMYHIMVDLVLHGSRFRPQRVDHMRNNLKRKKDDEINRYRALANNLGIIAVLIATVTFAAAFTLPGGYKNDSGTDAGIAILSKRAVFQAFLVSDTIAMASSITVAVILIYSGSLDHDVRLRSLMIALRLLWVAVCCMTVAFVTGVYAVVAQDCRWVAAAVAIIAFSVPFGALIITYWPSTDYLSRMEVALIPFSDKIKNQWHIDPVSFPQAAQKNTSTFQNRVSAFDVHLMDPRNQIELAKSRRPDDMSFLTPPSSSAHDEIVAELKQGLV